MTRGPWTAAALASLLGLLVLLLALGCTSGTPSDPGAGGPAGGNPDGSPVSIPEGMGALSFTIHWPGAEAGARLIPTGATQIVIEIYDGEETLPEVRLEVQKSDVVGGIYSTTVIVKPGEAKRIVVQALNARGEIVSQAEQTREVRSGQDVQVSLVLEPTGITNPVVTASAEPRVAGPGGTVTLTGTATDPDGTVVRYEWDTDGNGTYDYSSAVSGVTTVSPPDGKYTATFRATDNDGLKSTATVRYEVGTRPPEWVSVPASVSFNRGTMSDVQTLIYEEGIFPSPCRVEIAGAPIGWQPEPGASQATKSFVGRFYATDPTLAGSVVATLVLRDEEGRTNEEPVTVAITIFEGFHGMVTNLFSGSGIPSATVACTEFTASTDSRGEYLVFGVGTGQTRMNVTSSAIIERSFVVNYTPTGRQDVTVWPSTYNTTMFRALMLNDDATKRWMSPPTFVLYRQKYDSDPAADVAAADWAAMLDVVTNELPAISDNWLGGAPNIEVFPGRPNDDPRWTKSSSDPDWGYIEGQGAIGVAVRDTFSGGAAGLGGSMWDANYEMTGGGAVTLAGGGGYSDLRHVFRHEIGHAIGWSHPWTRIPGGESDPNLDLSVMNYINLSVPVWSNEFSDADRKAAKSMYHRAPGNVAPDYDPDNYVGFNSTGPITGAFYRDPLPGSGITPPPAVRFRIEGGRDIVIGN